MVTIRLQPKSSAGLRPSFTALARQFKVLDEPTRLAGVALLARREHCEHSTGDREVEVCWGSGTAHRADRGGAVSALGSDPQAVREPVDRRCVCPGP